MYLAQNFASITINCPEPEKSGWTKVMVNDNIRLCEVGEDCPATNCKYRYTAAEVKPCPTCNGAPDVVDPPYECSMCDVFGLVRISQEVAK